MGLRWAVLGFVALYCLWLLLINVALSTGLVASVVSGDRPRSRIRVQHGHAWSIWPTTVHIADLRVGIDTYKWQLDLTIPDASFETSLYALSRKILELDHLRGSDARITVVVKPTPEAADPRRLEYFPYSQDLPERIRQGERAPIPAADQTFRIAIRDADIGVTGLWINEFNADLDARLAGDLFVVAARMFLLPTMALDVVGGSVEVGTKPAVTSLHGVVRMATLPIELRAEQGIEAMRQISGRVDVVAAPADLAWTSLYTAGTGVRVARGQGALNVGVEVEHGMLAPGSTVSYRTERIRATRGEVAVSSGATLGARVDADGIRLRFKAGSLTSTRIGKDAPRKGAPWLEADVLTAKVRLGGRDLSRAPWPLAEASAALPSFRSADLARLGTLSSVKFRSGAVAGHAAAEKAHGSTMKISFAADADRVGLTVDKTRIDSNLYARADGTFDYETKAWSLDPLRINATALDLVTANGTTQGSTLKINKATLAYRNETDTLTASMRGALSPIQHVLVHARPGKEVTERLGNDGVGERDGAVSFSLTLERTPKATTVQVDRLQGPLLDARVTVSSAKQGTRAALLLTRGGIGVKTANGSREISVAVGAAWYDQAAEWARAVQAQ